MKILKYAIVAVIGIIIILAVRNKILLNECTDDLRQIKAQNLKIRKEKIEIEDAVIKSNITSMGFIGKQLLFEDIVQTYPEAKTGNSTVNRSRLVLVFSELGCNVCQDEETAFAVELAEQYGNDRVLAIIHANNIRYLKNYIRLNQVNFSVFYSKDEAFLNKNNIMNTPILFVIDENGRIIAAHIPIPGHSKFSEPMHRFCYNYLR